MIEKNWYVYQITFDDGSFYIGYRGTRKRPEDDFLIKYFSSSNIVTSKMKVVNYCGEILSVFTEQEVAYNTEQSKIFENFDNPLILNRACYFGRKGFGLLTAEAKKKIGQRSKELWATPEYQEKMASRGALRWTTESKKAQSDRQTGVKRPSQSEFMKGRIMGPSALRGRPQSAEHKAKISAAMKKPKSEEHKQKLRKPKPMVVTRIFDKRPMALGNFMNWNNKQS